MKIIKHGKPPKDKKHMIFCYNCHCLFICRDSETEFNYQSKNHYWGQRVKCPECNTANMIR